MRIFFIGEGRLGNQIFQYVALAGIASADARLFAVGLEDLEELFELHGPPLTVLRGGLWFKRLAKYVLAMPLRLLGKHLRLISYASESQLGGEHAGCDGRLEMRRGLIPSLLFVDGGYYQNSEFWQEVFPPRCLALREDRRSHARRVLAQRAGVTSAKPFFLHLRRGDYLGYSSHGVSDLMLPTDYFRRAIAAFRARGIFDLLVIVTDDAPWARGEFAGISNAVVISEDPRTDFAIMASCAGGIVSNSTFSLAAALFLQSPELVIAPEYWFGFRVQQWLPPRIRFEHQRIAYLQVLTRAAA